MKILHKPFTFTDYIKDIHNLLASNRTHVFIDTSFLMWLTTVGSSARSDFLGWVELLGRQRVHIPAWVSHEFHRHHINKKTSSTVPTMATDLKKMAEKFYMGLLPAFSEADNLPQQTSEQVRVEARETFSKIVKLSDIVSKWGKANSDKNSTEVIELINDLCLKDGNIFGYMNEIGELTRNRYSGRVPPGFQDKRKQDTDGIGGNSGGDLIFWKEILDHVRCKNQLNKNLWIDAILIITDDGKNDWLCGGGTTSRLDDMDINDFRETWDPLPIIHPMLEHEANVYSKAQRVALINRLYLGTYFLKKNKERLSFIKAAVITKFGSGKDISGRAKPMNFQDSPPQQVQENQAMGLETTTLLSRSSKLPSPSQLNQILFIKMGIEKQKEASDLLDSICVSPLKSLTDFITHDFLLEASTELLAWLGRDSATRSLNDGTIAKDRFQDLLGLLGNIDLPPASALYAGILVGTYFTADNHLRLPPDSPYLDQIMEHLKSDYAKPGITALVEAIPPGYMKPIYLPNVGGETLKAAVKTSNKDDVSYPIAIVIAGKDFLDEICVDPKYSFQTLFKGKDLVTSEELVAECCRLFGIPQSKVDLSGLPSRKVKVAPPAGFISPKIFYEVQE